jgi:Leucine-rich repeat (LRR) protein
LKELPSSIGQLHALQELYLQECLNLKELPSSIGQLTSIQRLDLSGCSELEELPSSIGQLTSIQKLDLFGWSKLKKLPSSIGQQKLDLLTSLNLKERPSCIRHRLDASKSLICQGVIT